MYLDYKKIFYSILMGGTAFLGMMRYIVYGVCLSPSKLGYLAIAITVSLYGVFLQLGVMNGLDRELPILFGKNKKTVIAQFVGETTIFMFYTQIIGFFIFGTVMLFVNITDTNMRGAFLLGGITSIAASFCQLVMLRLRSEQRYLTFALLQFAQAFAILIAGVLFIKFLGYFGAVFAHILVYALLYFICTVKVLHPVDYSNIEIKEIVYLIKIGFPLMITGICLTLQQTMDRFFMIKIFSSEEIGIYQIAFLPITIGVVINSIIRQYVIPLFLYRFGHGNNLMDLLKSKTLVSITIIVSLLLLWPVFQVVITSFINKWLPNYYKSKNLLFIFYIGSIFIAANIDVVSNAANRQRLLMYIYLIMIMLCFIGCFIGYRYHFKTNYFAYVNTGTQMISFLAVNIVEYFIAVSANRNIK